MKKNRAFWIFITSLILCFNPISTALADDGAGIKYSYPDFADEFTGKDSFENFNKKVFTFNLKFNKYIIKPINIVWASVMPQYGMNRVESFYTNLKYPIRLVGCLCQKDFPSAKSETVRFFTNTTLGVAGLYDVAQSKFKIEPHQEDMEQALAYYNLPQGPYLVLPVVAQGNIRDIAGQILDLPLNPTAYIVGPIALASTGLSLVNSTTSMQPIYKMAEGYADPYEILKQLVGIECYIKNNNLDRKAVFEEKNRELNTVNVGNFKKTEDSKANSSIALKDNQKSELKADINLADYNPQTPAIDSLRTMIFDSQKLNDSAWAELSVWNKSFSKKLKTTSVQVTPSRQNYSYRYVLQKDKTAPMAILYPSIGEGIMSGQSTVFAKMLWDEGYSVVILGSPFQWEFTKSMPDKYAPGIPSEDAKQLRVLTSKVLGDLTAKKGAAPDKKILVGTSFGGLTGLFVASQEEEENTLGISNYISINPPIEIFYALNQLDKYCSDWQKAGGDLKLRTAIMARKVVQVSQGGYKKDPKDTVVELPFTENEAMLAISYVMKMKLSNLIFTLENGNKTDRKLLYEKIYNMSFYDYSQKYLATDQNKTIEQLKYDSSLYSIGKFLKKSGNYKIYQSLDDCFTNREQLGWLKNTTGEKTVLFSNGSHMGAFYRKEFQDLFKSEIKALKASGKL